MPQVTIGGSCTTLLINQCSTVQGLTCTNNGANCPTDYSCQPTACCKNYLVFYSENSF